MSAFTSSFRELRCQLCGETADRSLRPGPCPHCGAMLLPDLDLDAIAVTPSDLVDRPFSSLWRYAELLPLEASAAVTLDEGATPLVSCPAMADELGVGSLLLKVEGRNPTGTFKDRGQTLAVTAAAAAGADHVALNSAGNAGHAAAAYAARAGIEAHVFLPARAGFTQKAMVNVHGGDLTVVEGTLDDAGRVYREALADHDEWFPVDTNSSPYRREGKKTLYYEIAEQLGWDAPDAIVFPTGGGVGLLGMAKAADELRHLGWVDRIPPFFAAQSTGCAPVFEAFEAGASDVEPVARPDTICGGIEVPAPGLGREILRVLRETDGAAVATDDDEILDAALSLADKEGIGIAPTAAAAISGVGALVDRDHLGTHDRVIAIATGTGLKEADILRSQLLSHGV